MSVRIAVIGSSNTDMIVKLDRLPKPGETVIGGEFSKAAGGKGANQAVAAARAGGDVRLIARVGHDSFGDQALERFRKEGLEISHVGIDPHAASGIALILVDKNGENSIGVASGANSLLTAGDIERARDVLVQADVVLLQLEVPLDTVKAAVAIASEARVKVILNPAPAQVLPKDILKKVSILTPNLREAATLTGINATDDASIAEAARILRGMGIETVIITLGERGAYLETTEVTEFIPAFDVQAVDTTAAGDVFNGALAVALAERKELREAVLFANAAAALSVTRLGAQPSAPRRSEIIEFL